MSLEDGFSEEEVKSIVWQLGEDGVLGLDGFPILFFKRFWILIKHDLLDFMREFFERGIISKDVGVPFITLIPVKDGAVELNDFRPIWLLGNPYKILANVLVNR